MYICIIIVPLPMQVNSLIMQEMTTRSALADGIRQVVKTPEEIGMQTAQQGLGF